MCIKIKTISAEKLFMINRSNDASKMHEKHLDFEQIKDLSAAEVIEEEKEKFLSRTNGSSPDGSYQVLNKQ